MVQGLQKYMKKQGSDLIHETMKGELLLKTSQLQEGDTVPVTEQKHEFLMLTSAAETLQIPVCRNVVAVLLLFFLGERNFGGVWRCTFRASLRSRNRSSSRLFACFSIVHFCTFSVDWTSDFFATLQRNRENGEKKNENRELKAHRLRR